MKVLKCKPELTTLEACSPPSPKGRTEREQKEADEKVTSKRKNEEEFRKIGGLTLELFALAFLIYNAVLLNMPNVDRRTTGILLLVSI